MKNTLKLLLALFFLVGSSCGGQINSNSQEVDKYTNHLIDETSPYLLQHAHNPVDWFPWGSEALEKAKKDDKLLIVSIGYSSCHWCHVMEEESFEDSTVAALMNRSYVSIKVDREERPDIDQIYMDAAMLINGRGGWPLNVITLPDGKPVFAGTYFPKENWMKVLNYFSDLYQKDPEKMTEQARLLTEGIAGLDAQALNMDEQKFSRSDVDKIFNKIYANLDPRKGGRTGAPKFPLPNKYLFLLEYYYHTKNQQTLNAVTTTLDNMALGGIYDHLGGGFARYSTDEDWKVPHFEKMLYDNAQLMSLYSKAYLITGSRLYRDVVYEIAEFISRELTSPEKAFYSSLDADSEGEEGKYYIWSYQEIQNVLGDNSELFFEFYNVQKTGNWENTNILYRSGSEREIADKFKISQEELTQTLAESKEKLLSAREKRIRPGLDDKILTSWNALMITGYVDAYRVFQEPKFLQAALDGGNFLLEKTIDDQDRITRNYKEGKATINGFLDDYSFTIEAFIGLYEATFDEQWLLKARDLTRFVLEQFQDMETGMLFYTSSEDNPLIVRKKELSDNVIPSSNSVMAKNLIRLGNFFYDSEFSEAGKILINNIKPALMENPGYYTNWAMALIDLTYPIYEVAIVGPEFQKKRKSLDQNYLPNVMLMGGKDEGSLELLRNKLVEDETFIYVCFEKACKLPTPNVDQALALIE